MNRKNGLEPTQPTTRTGWAMLALVLGTVTFTVALILMPVSLRFLTSNANLGSSAVQGSADWGTDTSGSFIGVSSESLTDSISMVQDAIPGITNKTIGRPDSANPVATAGGRNGLERESRSDNASFQSNLDDKPWSIAGGPRDGLVPFNQSVDAASASIQLARATAENVNSPMSRSIGKATQPNAAVSTQPNAAVSTQSNAPVSTPSDDAAKQGSPSPVSADQTASPSESDKATVQTIVEMRNKTTVALSRMLDSGFYAGYEADYLWLLNKSSMGLRLSQPDDQPVSISPAESYGPGGRIWIGMRTAERGIRATYSFYRGQNQDDAKSAGMPQLLSRAIAVHDLQTFDIEVTQPFRLAGVGLEVTAGARHLDYQGNDSLFVLAEPTSDLHAVGTSSATNSLSALGFTGSIHGKHVLPSTVFGDLFPFLHDDCDVSGCYTRRSFWYWDVRASALWGESKAAALTSAAVSVNNPSGAVGYAASRDYAMATNASESMLSTLELQLGIEHRRRLFMFPNADLVFRSGVEFRRFSLGRSFASAESFAFMQDDDDTFGLRLDAYSDSQDRVLRMLGLVFAVGANF